MTETPNGQRITQERQEPSYFAMIPKMALMDLSPYELTLYCHYKQIASEGGACYKSNKTLAAETKMSVSQLKRARAELERRHYITVEHHADAVTGVENAPVTVTITDVWAINHQQFVPATQGEGVFSQDGGVVLPEQGVVLTEQGGGSVRTPKNNSLKNINTKTKDVRAKKPRARKAASPNDSAPQEKIKPARKKPYDDVAHELRVALIEAWCTSLPAPPTNAYSSTTNHTAAAEIHRAGYLPDDVKRFVTAAMQDSYWRGKTLTLAKVGELMPAWLRVHPARPPVKPKSNVEAVILGADSYLRFPAVRVS